MVNRTCAVQGLRISGKAIGGHFKFWGGQSALKWWAWWKTVNTAR